MGRPGTVDEVAAAVAYLASPRRGLDDRSGARRCTAGRCSHGSESDISIGVVKDLSTIYRYDIRWRSHDLPDAAEPDAIPAPARPHASSRRHPHATPPPPRSRSPPTDPTASRRPSPSRRLPRRPPTRRASTRAAAATRGASRRAPRRRPARLAAAFGGFGGPGFGPAAVVAAPAGAPVAVTSAPPSCCSSPEQPMHGYQLIQEIGERSGGQWRPSPGAIYPALNLLEDEGLVAITAESGRKLATPHRGRHRLRHRERRAARQPVRGRREPADLAGTRPARCPRGARRARPTRSPARAPTSRPPRRSRSSSARAGTST